MNRNLQEKAHSLAVYALCSAGLHDVRSIPRTAVCMAARWRGDNDECALAVCMYMYVCRDIYVHAAAYSLDCHRSAMIYRMLYKTFQFLVERRTESVTTMNHELSVAVSSI